MALYNIHLKRRCHCLKRGKSEAVWQNATQRPHSQNFTLFKTYYPVGYLTHLATPPLETRASALTTPLLF
jgi:hypothetical protein